MEINTSSIIDILTLRYDTSLDPNLPKKTSADFLPIETTNIPNHIESAICSDMQNRLDCIKEKEISIALSGGVDSTLVLSLLDKIKSEKKIHAISIKFADSIDETENASKIAA